MPPSGSTAITSRMSPMPKGPDRDNIDKTWEYLADGITKIMSNLQSGMTMDDVSK